MRGQRETKDSRKGIKAALQLIFFNCWAGQQLTGLSGVTTCLHVHVCYSVRKVVLLPFLLVHGFSVVLFLLIKHTLSEMLSG